MIRLMSAKMQPLARAGKVLVSCGIPCTTSRSALGSGCSLVQTEDFHQSKLTMEINYWKIPNLLKVCRDIYFFLKVSPLWKELIPFETFYEHPVSSPSSPPANPGWLPALTQCPISPWICELLHKGTLWHRPGLGTGTFTTLSQVLQNKRRNMSWDFHANFSLLEAPGGEFVKSPLKNPFQEASL